MRVCVWVFLLNHSFYSSRLSVWLVARTPESICWLLARLCARMDARVGPRHNLLATFVVSIIELDGASDIGSVSSRCMFLLTQWSPSLRAVLMCEKEKYQSYIHTYQYIYINIYIFTIHTNKHSCVEVSAFG